MRVSSILRAAGILAVPLWAAAGVLAADADANANARDDAGPVIKATAFSHQPDNLNYFEDSDVILFHDYVEGIVYRSADAGASWDKVPDIPAQTAARLVMHNTHAERAYVLTEGTKHFRTEDRGQTWTPFSTGVEMSMFQYETLTFHARDPDRIIFQGMDYNIASLSEVAMYTTDGFRTDAKPLRRDTSGCWWVVSSDLFTTGADDLDQNRIMCIVRDPLSPRKQDQRLVISDNYFQAASGGGGGSGGPIQQFEPNLDTDRPVQGIVNVAAVKKYLLVATTSVNTDEMALFVTDDTKVWHRAVFPSNHRLNQEAYTVLESTNYSIQIDVMNTRPADPMGVLLTSNSNGTFFTENLQYTNRNKRGHVDFEKISGIQGIFLVNRVDNGEAVDKERAAKKIVTEITFDDGRTFAPVTLGGDGKKRLHVHSVTELSNIGRVFSSPAPGLVMAIGNTGEYLGAYQDGNLYISDDAGASWIEGPKGPHKYEFGDQGSILVAVRDAADVDEVTYSLDHGKTWRTAKLPDGLRVRPYILTTTQDSTSLKFVLVGEEADKDKGWHMIALDFGGLHEATCKDGDFEEWWARVDAKGEPTCLMGHKQRYHRRKKDAACFLNSEFRDPVVETIDCDCTDLDFECDFNFRRNDKGDECVPAGPMVVPEGACGKDAKDANKADAVFQGSSGWRLIPGNTCRRTGGKQKDDPVERKCSEAGAGGPGGPGGPGNVSPPPATGEVATTRFDFELDAIKGYNDFEKHYLERGDTSSATFNNEAIIMRPVDLVSGRGGPIFVTDVHGKTWTRPAVFDKETVWAIVPHAYFKEVVFFVTAGRRVIYTVDHGQQWHEFEAPYEADKENARVPLMFHPDKKDWLIWVGKKCEATGACYTEASVSRDRGDNWQTLLRYVERCEFVGSSEYKVRQAKEVLCVAHAREEGGGGNSDANAANPLQLVSSDDWFEEHREVQADNVKGFATMAEFIVVAAEDTEKKTLKALASLDGETYAEAHFPVNFAMPEHHEYTVLDSSTHAINLFVATEMAKDRRHGTIIKSNSNGTSYVLSIAGVNCDNRYYVDFEKMLGLEGVVLVNIVANRDDDKALSATGKVLQTQISHNDGAEWAFLPPPAKDVDGKAYGCRPRKGKGVREGGDYKCALHIHGYTERADYGQQQFSSESAVGLMFGVGNVGDRLGDIADADTFMTADAGITWRNVKKGAWRWQFGDQGSIVVLVPRQGRTRSVSYSTDEGATWQDHQFSDDDVDVLDMTTLRSGASRNFLLWCRAAETAEAEGGHLFTVNLDFSGLADRPCEHNEKDLAQSDYYTWSPTHPLLPQSQCLFGHVTQYLRKKTDRTCYNGHKLQHQYNTQNCTCSRRDYECDYNYELDNHGQCSLVAGLAPLSKAQWCADHPDAVDYYPPTGFRRIPLTTCEGGDEYDKLSTPEPCPNREDDFGRRHGRRLGWFAILLIVLASVGGAAAVAFFAMQQVVYRFGTIRLGEGSGGGGGGLGLGSRSSTSRLAFDFQRPDTSAVVRYTVMAAAGVVAVARTLPVVGVALWRTGADAVTRWRTGGRFWGGGRNSSGPGGGGGGGGGGVLNLSRRFTTRDSLARGGGGAYTVVDDDDEEGELLGDDSDEE